MSSTRQVAEPTGELLVIQSIDLGLRVVVKLGNILTHNPNEHGEMEGMFIVDSVRTSGKFVGVTPDMTCGDVIRRLSLHAS